MLSIPLSLFIIIYALFALITLIFAFINIYHIVSAGALNLLSFSVSAIVVLGMVGIIVLTGMYVGILDVGSAAIFFETVPTLPTL